MLVSKRGGTLAIIMTCVLDELWKYSCTMGYLWAPFRYCLHEFMPCWNFEYTKAVTLHCAKVGGGMDQGPATKVTHLNRLNQPFSFCSDIY